MKKTILAFSAVLALFAITSTSAFAQHGAPAGHVNGGIHFNGNAGRVQVNPGRVYTNPGRVYTNPGRVEGYRGNQGYRNDGYRNDGYRGNGYRNDGNYYRGGYRGYGYNYGPSRFGYIYGRPYLGVRVWGIPFFLGFHDGYIYRNGYFGYGYYAPNMPYAITVWENFTAYDPNCGCDVPQRIARTATWDPNYDGYVWFDVNGELRVAY